MPAYSIFALGTFENTNNEKNIITQFHKVCTNEREKLILDGPQRLIDPDAVERNVDKAVTKILEWLESPNTLPDANGKYVINLSGFSRGAVTCVRIANRLYEYLNDPYTRKPRNVNRIRGGIGDPISNQDLALNIFAVDPVAGLFEKYRRNSQNLPPIVKNYVGILMMDEFRHDLKPQDLKRIYAEDPNQTQVSMHPLYGHHRSSKKIVGRNVGDCTRILWQQLYQFLDQHGTQIGAMPPIPHLDGTFEDASPLDDLKILELYAQAKKHRAAYQAIGNSGVSFSGNGTRGFLNYLNDYVSDPSFFINQFEMNLFKKSYRAVMSYLFEGGADHGYPNEYEFKRALIRQLRLIQTDSQALFASLIAAKKINVEFGNITIPRRATGYVPLDIADVAIRRLLRYRYSKPEWKTFTRNDEHERTSIIEREINRIRADSNTNAREEQILNLIEKHAREIYESGSSSKLLGYLLEVLSLKGRNYDFKPNMGLLGTIGKLTEMLGSLVKKLTQGAAFLVGGSGTVTEFLGNLTKFSGEQLASLFYLTKVLAPVGLLAHGATFIVGSGLNLLGRGMKWTTTRLLSPGLEWLGKTIRNIGQAIVRFSDSFKLVYKRSPDELPASQMRPVNLGLRALAKKSDLESSPTAKAVNLVEFKSSGPSSLRHFSPSPVHRGSLQQANVDDLELSGCKSSR